MKTNTADKGVYPADDRDCYHSSTEKSCAAITPKASVRAESYEADTTLAASTMFDNIAEPGCILKGCVLKHVKDDGSILDAASYSLYPADSNDWNGASLADAGALGFTAATYTPNGVQQSFIIACTNSKVSPRLDITVTRPPVFVTSGFCKVFKSLATAPSLVACDALRSADPDCQHGNGHLSYSTSTCRCCTASDALVNLGASVTVNTYRGLHTNLCTSPTVTVYDAASTPTIRAKHGRDQKTYHRDTPGTAILGASTYFANTDATNCPVTYQIATTATDPYGATANAMITVNADGQVEVDNSLYPAPPAELTFHVVARTWGGTVTKPILVTDVCRT